MGVFSGSSGSGSGSSGRDAAASGVHPRALASLAALPALLASALWKVGGVVSSSDGDGALAKKQGSKAHRGQGQGHARKPQSAAAAAAASAPAVVVVDPYSSGGVLARLAHDEGYRVVRVLSCSSQRMADQSLPAACKSLAFAATVVVRRPSFLMVVAAFRSTARHNSTHIHTHTHTGICNGGA